MSIVSIVFFVAAFCCVVGCARRSDVHLSELSLHNLRRVLEVMDKHNPGTAAVLSLIVPGVGQIYNGDFLRGVFWLIITPGFWIFTAGLFGWPFHLVAAYTAYRRATKKNLAVLDSV